MFPQATRSQLALITSLHRSSNRRESGLFLAEGEKVVDELLQSKISIHSIYGTKLYFENRQGVFSGKDVFTVGEKDLERISTLVTPNQVLAVCHIPVPNAFDFLAAGKTILLLDGISDPGNLGTIIRTADWFGVDAVFCSPGSADHWNSKVIQSAMGSLFRIPVYKSPLSLVLDSIESAGIYASIGGVLNGSPLDQIPKDLSAIALVIGSESHGISMEIQSRLNYRATISKGRDSKTESLNAAVATGILLFQFTKK